ncbi:hypothetical protein G7068_04905 [Leucobacter viscericola]|uniref:Uncharacterized protein n=1 Tax=Leucobacter viscericola TaxID=2714935 RepID=A0A6G7XE28_9MICO|nr:hypothetical protein [Leucobacter viscericola]QIK62621.1 hypothetical protein G7068_04905 [Leucobacter viscericola]
MRHSHRIISPLLICVIAASVTGCTNGSKNQEEVMLPEISMVEARTTQNDELRQIMTHVPDEIIVKNYGLVPQSRAMSCNWADEKPMNPEEGIFLAGTARADITAEADLLGVLSQIRVAYESKPGWTVKPAEKASMLGTDEGVLLVSPENYTYHVDVSTETSSDGVKEFTASSFSPCFQIPDDFDRFKEY